MVTYLSRIYGPLYSLQHVYRRFRYSVVDLERMIKYFELTNEVKDRVGAKALKITNDTVTFEDITFAYDKDKSILNNISFTVPAGKKVALVGASGEGKSTIIKLLLRFYDPQKGKILIDGQDIKKIKQSSLRENIAIVPQETSLFNNTIAHNIAYGKLNAKPREIDEASQLSRLDRLVKRLKKGYKTIVGERGIKLSGGEKQRVAIARAMLKDAPILILDEATSSLDSQTESEIQKSLDELMKGKTTLIIAHRLSTVMKSDFIVVIKNGQVAEVGNHSELTKTGGLYNHLWQMQSQGYLK